MAARREEPNELLLSQLVAHETHRRGIASDDEGNGYRLAGRPPVLPREPVGVRRAQDRRSHRRIGPAVELGDVLGVERQPRRQLESARRAGLAQQLDLGPRRLGVDVVDRHRRDAAPVIDPGVEEKRKVVVGEVRRGLDMDTGAEHDAGNGYRPEMLLHRRVGVVGHPRPGLRTEVLNDDLAQMPVLLRERAQCKERIDPLGARLADPDQDPARERDRELPGEPHGLEAPRRHLVGRGPVRAAARREPLGLCLEHDPHRRGDRPQRRELVARHHARVQVRQEPRLVEHPLGAPGEVLERRLAAERLELLARDAVASLGAVAEGEERLAAPRLCPGSSDREHLVLGEVGGLTASRRSGERAVAADVAAERRQRDEDLRGVGDERPGAPGAQVSRLDHEVVE